MPTKTNHGTQSIKNDPTDRPSDNDKPASQSAESSRIESASLAELEAAYLSDLPAIDTENDSDALSASKLQTLGELNEETVQCPYCWEHIEVFIDPSVDQQQYVEDCQVCCRPIIFDVEVHENDTNVVTSRENDND